MKKFYTTVVPYGFENVPSRSLLKAHGITYYSYGVDPRTATLQVYTDKEIRHLIPPKKFLTSWVVNRGFWDDK
jgi:hypothetical protein